MRAAAARLKLRGNRIARLRVPASAAATAVTTSRTVNCLAVLLPIALMGALAAAPAPTIERVTLQGDTAVTIEGRGFGAPCARCEVIATYDDGLRYAVSVLQWAETWIAVRVPDLNRGQVVRLLVRAGEVSSNAAPLSLARHIDTQVAFAHASDAKVGDRGERQVDVGFAAPGCGVRSPVFERAELRHLRRRFGEAQIVAAPPAGCTACAPLTVRWYHEPTGYLDFNVHVHRRWVEGVCGDRTR